MTLHITLGNPQIGPSTRLDDKKLFIVTDEGEGDENRVLFQVTIGKDGKSINVRCCGTTQLGDVLYSSSLVVLPNSSNSIDISVEPYE